MNSYGVGLITQHSATFLLVNLGPQVLAGFFDIGDWAVCTFYPADRYLNLSKDLDEGSTILKYITAE